ncbi:MAG: PrpF family protein [Alphaproteobacteria bacterium]|nr:PrpF family protein [Alphaproteobacteria bacterium]
MPQQRLRAVFMRGGTSKAVMFRQGDLPADRDAWAPLFLAVMGSPDPNGRQLDGMGGGISSLSKVCVIGPPSRDDADVDYTFAQVAVDRAIVDYSGNCGNMSSAVGPFAVDEGMVPRPNGRDATVRIHNTNTRKIIVSRFGMDGEQAAVIGDLALDGVAGTGAPIRLDFTDPAGARTGRLLPSGHATDMLDVPGLGQIEASMIDAANPCVFVRAADLGRSGTERPDALERDSALLDKLEAIRRAASMAMGIAPDTETAAAIPSVPKVAMLAAPAEVRTLSGRTLTAGDIDILVRMISVGQPHRAVPLTGALCLAVACRVPGSIAHQLAGVGQNGDLRIGHASGVVLVAANARVTANGIEVPYATVYRTARRLFQGEVFYPALERRQAT